MPKQTDLFFDLVEQLRVGNPDDGNISRRLNELIALSELMATLNTARELDEMLDILLLTMMGQHPCSKAGIFVREDKGWRLGISKGFRGKGLVADQLPAPDDLADLPPVLHVDEAADGPLEPLFESFRFERVITARNEEKLVGLIFLGKSLLGKLSEDKTTLLKMFADFGGVIMGNRLYRVDLEKVNRQLQRRVFQLNTLYEITGAFARCFEPDDVYQILANNIMGNFFISRCAVLTDYRQPSPAFVKGLARDTTIDGGLDEASLADWPRQVLKRDQLPCPKMKTFMSANKLAYGVPIFSEDVYLGVLLLGSRLDRKPLSDADREFMVSLSQQAAVALENVRLQAEVLEKKRMERELQLAREIQQRLLPKAIPALDGYQIDAEMRPYNHVGGDFYDFFQHKNGCLSFCLADVSGKSLPASMIMSTAQASLRALTSFDGMSPHQVIEKLNLHLFQSTQSNKFVTLFFGFLDPEDHTLEYINAGHNRPIMVCSEQKVQLLHKGGMMVGMFPNAKYEVGTVPFEKGSLLLVYTDGLSEVADEEGEELGDDRLVDLVKRYQKEDDVGFGRRQIVKAAMDFSKGEMVDDLTLLLIRRNT
ncbi:SpoIIE family protein phosphatase [Acanthopleuribacter pedis]|uniref:SpoIIE family protein phosphatase n=1 Tax=Acanthopleuribacter pedis TaxID=442870 RepID=A0A8J7QFQ3_9BACT|nr:SpoIIE family protein phosphatase [Acanthopleuribacter pedis]